MGIQWMSKAVAIVVEFQHIWLFQWMGKVVAIVVERQF